MPGKVSVIHKTRSLVWARFALGLATLGCLLGLWYLVVHPEVLPGSGPLVWPAVGVLVLSRSYTLGVWVFVLLLYASGLLLGPLTRRPAASAARTTWWHVYVLSALVLAPCLAPLDPHQYGILRNALQLTLPLLCAAYASPWLASRSPRKGEQSSR